MGTNHEGVNFGRRLPPTGGQFSTLNNTLTPARREAAALERVLSGCWYTDMIVTGTGAPTAAPRTAPAPTRDELRLYDYNSNGQITC